MSKWTKVYNSEIMHKAEIVKGILDEYELSPVIINKQDSNYKFGQYEVHVPADYAVRAFKIIQDEIKVE